MDVGYSCGASFVLMLNEMVLVLAIERFFGVMQAESEKNFLLFENHHSQELVNIVFAPPHPLHSEH